MLFHMNLTLGTLDASARRLALIWAGVSVIAVVSVVIAPIAAFVLMISAFGLPHVLYELRYVDERFSARTPRQALAIIGGLVALIALGRIANGLHWLMGDPFIWYEFSLGALLAFTAAAFMRENRLLGAVIGCTFALGVIYQPILTFVVWAWVHNLTPLGFVAEITVGEERRRWILLLGVPFFALPALVATGVFHQMGALLFHIEATQSLSMFGAGDKPLLSFLPPGFTDMHLFSAAVVAQSMHYVAVIVLLPQLLKAKNGGRQETIVPWPSWRVFAGAVAAISVVAFGIYAVAYTDARAGYSVAAAVHAWIELPILLMAVGQGFTSLRR